MSDIVKYNPTPPANQPVPSPTISNEMLRHLQAPSGSHALSAGLDALSVMDGTATAKTTFKISENKCELEPTLAHALFRMFIMLFGDK